MTIHILIVDDDPMLGLFLADTINQESPRYDFQASYAPTVDEARIAAQHTRFPFDIFLIDYRLGPGLNGIELMLEMQRLSPGSDTILFTGYNDEDAGLRAYEAGAYRYIQKPFEPEEIIWILISLVRRRSIQYERDWLRILASISEKAQGIISRRELAKIVCDGGVQLGFERARFYSLEEIPSAEINDDTPILYGVYQCGGVVLASFDQVRIALNETTYVKSIVEEGNTLFFHGLQLGQGFLFAQFASEGFGPPVGEWVGIPLRVDRRTRAVLVLDNAEQDTDLRQEQRELLRLFAREIEAALARTYRSEEEQRRNQVHRIVQEITNLANRSVPKGNYLESLLGAVKTAIIGHVPVGNLIIVVTGERHWLYNGLYIQSNGSSKPPFWRRPNENGLVAHVARDRKQPLFLPDGTSDYRTRHYLDLVGPKSALSFMAVPFVVAGTVVGAIVLEDDVNIGKYTVNDFQLLQELAQQLASHVFTAWLNEQKEQMVNRLVLLQRASETIMLLAEQREDWLWHATLTLTTAAFGFRFDRALLLLKDKEGKSLKMRMGIGHFRRADAERDEEQGDGYDDFNHYLERLQTGQLTPTPLEIDIQQTPPFDARKGVFAQVLATGKCAIVTVGEESEEFPAEFLQFFCIPQYPDADYRETTRVLVPLKAHNDVLGLVVLDNVWQREPEHFEAIEYIDVLTNEAALIYQNLRLDLAQAVFIEFSNQIQMSASLHPLPRTLDDICSELRQDLDADMIAIIPFDPDKKWPHYEIDMAGFVGRQSPVSRQSEQEFHSTSLTDEVLNSGTLAIANVDLHTGIYAGQPLSEHPMIQAERIKALCGIPINDPNENRPTGVLYLDYRTPKEFSVEELRLAKQYAHLAAIAIRQAHTREETERQTKDREDELRILGEVLEESLERDVLDIAALSKLLLEKSRQILEAEDVSIKLFLRDWQRSTPNDELTEIRRQYSLQDDGELSIETENDLIRGVSGLAIETGQTQYIRDIKIDQRRSRFYTTRPKTQSELDVPIILDQRSMGVFNVESPRRDAFTAYQVAAMERMAAAAALALDIMRRQVRLQSILDAASAVTAPSTLQSTLDAIADAVLRALPELPLLTVWYIDPENPKVIVPGTQVGGRVKRTLKPVLLADEPLFERVMSTPEAVWVDDAANDPRLDRQFIQEEGLKATIIFPLRSGDEPVGIMFFSYREPHLFSPEEYLLFPILAKIVASAISDVKHLEREKRQRERFEVALEITKAIGTELEIEPTLTTVLEQLTDKNLFRDTTPCILIFNKEDNVLEFSPASSAFYAITNKSYVGGNRVLLDNNSLAGSLALRVTQTQTREIWNVPNVDDPACFPIPDIQFLRMREKTQSQLTAPLIGEEGGLLGMLVLESEQRNAYGPEDERTVQVITGQIEIAIGRSRQREALEFNSTIAAATAWATEIAHDINQEVFHIRSWTEALLSDDDMSDQLRNYVQRIDSSAKVLSGTLLPVSQVAERVPLDSLLHRLLPRLLHEFGRGITPHFALGCDGLEIETYPLALERILRHLVRNARHAMQEQPENIEPIILLATAPCNNDAVDIWFADTGPGIPPKYHRQIFRQQLKDTGPGKNGLGLLLVRFLVEQIGGSIRLEQRTREHEPGTCFRIRLPLYK